VGGAVNGDDPVTAPSVTREPFNIAAFPGDALLKIAPLPNFCSQHGASLPSDSKCMKWKSPAGRVVGAVVVVEVKPLADNV
jgi:hypothetical protein